ncbi:MAG: hypothetical protein JSS12_05325 [Verrucomicrobia bacterium]|nr:hypothetical protein [Verrucomicrobiota bacterium]
MEKRMGNNASSVQGNIPEIILNTENLYEGNLSYYFKVVFENAKNLKNPYHNFRHMMHVTWLCYDACRHYKKVLTKREMRNLLIAAMFHDFDHPGKARNDELNVEKAIKGLKKWIAPEDKPYFDMIAGPIKTTVYPYKRIKHLTLQQQILRDSDLCQVFSPVWLQQVVFGLAAEIGCPAITFLRSQEKFIGKIKFNTEWAKDRFDSAKLIKIKEVRDLLKILE